MERKTILLVDDDTDDVELFNIALKEADPNAICYSAGNGNEALEMLYKMSELPDFIFLDLNMPLMDGKECLAELKRDERLKNIPVIICTTSFDLKDKEITKKLGAACFLTKSINFQKFCDEIAMVLQMAFHHG